MGIGPEEMDMTIRTYQPGDELAQVGIYNEAAAELPKFKPATIDEVRRRLRGPDFDPGLRFYGIVNNRPVAYFTCQANGRVSYPWCRRGHESLAEPLFEQGLSVLKERGLKRVFAAYRADWAPQRAFLESHGFKQVREMVNYVMDLPEMPTPGNQPMPTLKPLDDADITALPALGAGVLRTADVAALTQHFLHNPYFSADASFVYRGRSGTAPLAVGLLIVNPSYADPKAIDPAMPCYRLGAAGTEGLTTKRVNGLFSLIAPDNRDFGMMAIELLNYAARKLEKTDVGTFAAQAPSDATHLTRFYKQYFRRQGAFPVFERDL